MRGRDAHQLLLRAIRTAAGGDAEVGAASSVAWSSATFQGARHRIMIDLAGPEAEARATRLSRRLSGAEFALPGHLVADVAITARYRNAAAAGFTVEALTVEEA